MEILDIFINKEEYILRIALRPEKFELQTCDQAENSQLLLHKLIQWYADLNVAPVDFCQPLWGANKVW